ncbi:MAG: Hsp20/alpha crystallin family protein [Candidatus Adiutrix sp.]|jgi:HSP20 family protein|nr:Hsp20/alpha crystallin family protein [Candidatus Adiutrix sp.]
MSRFRFQPRSGRGLPSFWELEKMRDHMETIYNTLAGSVSSQLRKNFGVFPLINLSEDDERLYLTCELPGADPGQLEVSVKGETLNLRGRVGSDGPGAEVNFHRRERESGAFRRTLTLPVKVEADRVDAVFKNGVLTVTMPKSAEAKAHRVSVKAE